MDSKTEIRNKMINKRMNLNNEIKARLDEGIYMNVCKSTIFKKAENIFIYVSLDYEVDTKKIINKAFSLGKSVSVPKVISKSEGMAAVNIKSLSELSLGKYNILEPEIHNNIASANEFDLIIVPGLAFDKKGGRLGYGGGFYDRYLKNCSSTCNIVALSYSFQIIDEVPMDINDIKINNIITEKENLVNNVF
ncbi:5-formyltetrahydrofolate cyclo-ligase [Clostridium sp. JN-9]|uniref:5-formyltetrahydrofolate cyclo-ligase n=1 Tax=Clostridium sp. JN-9 TaxID=2507159 RepID=UPI0013E8E708|nr:5-formyltetrahydrofolate cyclo-ligase [Clostridium sp. JN-9]